MRKAAPTRLLAVVGAALATVCAFAAPTQADVIATDLHAPSADRVLNLHVCG